MALTPDQLRAARALLNISQDELAKRSGVAVTSIRQFELGATTNLQQKTENALLSHLGERLEFIGQRGVALREADHLILDGEDAIAKMFKDINAHLHGQKSAEALFLCGDESSLLSPDFANYCAALRKAGFSYRSVCYKKKATAPVHVVPETFMPLALQVTYGSSVAQMIAPERILLVRSPMLANGLKQTFERLWETTPSDDTDAQTPESACEEPLRA